MTTRTIKQDQDKAVDSLEQDVRDLLEAYYFLETLSVINDTDTLLVAARCLEEEKRALPAVADELVKTFRKLATASFAQERAAKRRAAGCPPQDEAVNKR